MKKLTIEKLTFSYGKKSVLEAVDLELNKGEILCLLGPNGCGKSTLMDCLMQHHSDYKGSITCDGIDLRKLPHRERAKLMAYVPQCSETTFLYTAFQMILMGRTPHAAFFSSPGREDEAQVYEIASRLNIEAHLSQTYNTLSGGQQQLVKIARGLVQGACIQVLDEPMAALDLKHEIKLLNVIGQLIKDAHTSVIMSTHAPNQAFLLENMGVNVKVCLMKEGQIKYQGKPSDVITSETIRDIYGIESGVVSYLDEYRNQSGYVLVPSAYENTGE